MYIYIFILIFCHSHPFYSQYCIKGSTSSLGIQINITPETAAFFVQHGLTCSKCDLALFTPSTYLAHLATHQDWLVDKKKYSGAAEVSVDSYLREREGRREGGREREREKESYREREIDRGGGEGDQVK